MKSSKEIFRQENKEKLYDDAVLFMWFINAVNSDAHDKSRLEDDDGLMSKRRAQKLRFKSFDTDAENFIEDNGDVFTYEEDRNGFLCKYCDARYVYKRCLINHLIKTHKNEHDLNTTAYN